MNTKAKILAEIQRLAEVHGGHIGLRPFLRETGIPQSQILGRHWASWNEALQEAGIEKTREFSQPRIEDSVVFEAITRLIDRLGCWPTQIQLRMERRTDPSFPSLVVFQDRMHAPDFLERLSEHCESHACHVKAIVDQQPRPNEHTGERLERIQGYVYMMRSGRNYKIGFTNTPARRHREVKLELPAPTHLFHTIETDDPRGIESYWHRRFAAKRIRDTEFFKLDSSEVQAFKRRKYQ